jgi:mRNA interferase RelE/StbE
LKGEIISIDVKKMKGKWKGFYRLRDGKKRIIFQINFEEHKIYLDRIDFRGMYIIRMPI